MELASTILSLSLAGNLVLGYMAYKYWRDCLLFKEISAQAIKALYDVSSELQAGLTAEEDSDYKIH